MTNKTKPEFSTMHDVAKAYEAYKAANRDRTEADKRSRKARKILLEAFGRKYYLPIGDDNRRLHRKVAKVDAYMVPAHEKITFTIVD